MLSEYKTIQRMSCLYDFVKSRVHSIFLTLQIYDPAMLETEYCNPKVAFDKVILFR